MIMLSGVRVARANAMIVLAVVMILIASATQAVSALQLWRATCHDKACLHTVGLIMLQVYEYVEPAPPS